MCGGSFAFSLSHLCNSKTVTIIIIIIIIIIIRRRRIRDTNMFANTWSVETVGSICAANSEVPQLKYRPGDRQIN